MLFGRRLQCWRRLKPLVCQEQFGDDLKIVGVICGDMKDSRRAERNIQCVYECLVEQTVFVVSSLWPRIREEDVHCGDGFLRQEAADGIAGFDTDEPDVG